MKMPKSLGEFQASKDLDLMEKVVSSMTVRNEDYQNLFSELLEKQRGNPLVDLLSLFENFQSGLPQSQRSINEILEYFEKSTNSDLQWEQLVAAACLNWFNGNFLKAAALLESAVGRSPLDPLLLNLSQSCYRMTGGLMMNHVLGCFARHVKIFQYGQTFRPTAIAQLSMGYIEVNRLLEAEEFSNRAVAMSGYCDIAPLISLCTSFYFQGKISDITEHYDKYLSSFTSGDSKLHLTCLRGHALIMRGNCHGAYNTALSIVENISKDSLDNPPYLPFPVFQDIVMLLWHVSLHATPQHMMALDSIVKPLLNYISRYTYVPKPSQHICQALLLATYINGLETKNTTHQLQLEGIETQYTTNSDPDTSDSKKGLISSFLDSFRNRKVRNYQSDPSDTRPPGLRFDEKDYHMKNLSDDLYSKQEIDRLHSNLQKLLQKASEEVAKQREETRSFVNKYPNLLRVRPSAHYLPYSHKEDDNQLDSFISMREQSQSNLLYAIINFSLRKYDEATPYLATEAMTEYKATGLSKLHRDILQQTFIESLIRSGEYESARSLLLERTITVPNDGQNWIRLARIYRILGEMELENEALGIAHQLGIGQGGFGGTI